MIMATALQFRTEQAANSILRKDKAKLDWSMLDIETCPHDIKKLAMDMMSFDLAYRQAKAALEDALADKAVIPAGKRLIVTTGRQSSPNDPAPILFAVADGATTKSTRLVSFDQFIKS
jgi:hypothetical protein